MQPCHHLPCLLLLRTTTHHPHLHNILRTINHILSRSDLSILTISKTIKVILLSIRINNIQLSNSIMLTKDIPHHPLLLTIKATLLSNINNILSILNKVIRLLSNSFPLNINLSLLLHLSQ